MGSFQASGYLDDVKWHYQGDYPAGLPRDNAATHMGMFLVWAIGRRLASPRHQDRRSPLVQQVASRSIPPGQYFLKRCRGWLTEEDFNDRGHRFADARYDVYLREYGCLFDGLESLYHAPDSWETFEDVAEELDDLLESWESSQDDPGEK